MSALQPDNPAARGQLPSVSRRVEDATMQRVKMYRVAYKESQRTLDDQADELTGIRTRAVQYLAFIGTATAFLVGASLKTFERDTPFYAISITATGLSVLMLVSVILTL